MCCFSWRIVFAWAASRVRGCLPEARESSSDSERESSSTSVASRVRDGDVWRRSERFRWGSSGLGVAPLATVVGLPTRVGNVALLGVAVLEATVVAVVVEVVVDVAVAAAVAGAVALVGASAAAMAVLAGSPVVGATELVGVSVGLSEDI